MTCRATTSTGGPGSSKGVRTRHVSAVVMCVSTLVWGTAIPVYCFGTSPGPLGPRIVDLVTTDGSVIVAYCDSRWESWVDSYDAQTGRLSWRKHFPRVPLVGRLCLAPTLLCVPTLDEGVYVLYRQDGAQKACLRVGTGSADQRVGCTRSRILVSGLQSKGRVAHFVAFDTTSFRLVWRRDFRGARVWQLASGDETFELLLSEPSGRRSGQSLWRYEKVILNAVDGHVVSRQLVARPADHDIIPESLPAAMRKWLTEVLSRKGGVLLARTQLLQMGKVWFVGNLEDRTAPGTVFAVRSTGQVVWRRRVPELAAILLHDRELIAASYGADPEKRRLTAFDADTGKPLWAARLE